MTDIINVKKRLVPSLLVSNQIPYKIIEIEKRFICNEYQIILNNGLFVKLILKNCFHPQAAIKKDSSWKESMEVYNSRVPPKDQVFCLSKYFDGVPYQKIKKHIEPLIRTYNFDNGHWKDWDIMKVVKYFSEKDIDELYGVE